MEPEPDYIFYPEPLKNDTAPQNSAIYSADDANFSHRICALPNEFNPNGANGC
jgi:hypothetical protein